MIIAVLIIAAAVAFVEVFGKMFVGSDYKGTERFNRYEEYFKDKDVEIMYFPYTQSTSSTQIRKSILEKTKSFEKIK